MFFSDTGYSGNPAGEPRAFLCTVSSYYGVPYIVTNVVLDM